ncbi:MAG: ATP-binding cassette domain-containing protein, partial [Bacteroidota bacterium]
DYAISGAVFRYQKEDPNPVINIDQLNIRQGEKVAILGRNGAGKSTLLRLLMGMETPLEGQVSLGEHNVIPAYFEHNQAEALDLSKEVLAMVFDAVPDWSQSQVRSFLGRFGFSNDTVFKEAALLSGGEKARLALALLLLRPSNLLLLDEPTNHLDLETITAFNEALQDWKHIAIFSSHDHTFTQSIANRIIELTPNGVLDKRMSYDEYLEDERIQELRGKLYADTLSA